MLLRWVNLRFTLVLCACIWVWGRRRQSWLWISIKVGFYMNGIKTDAGNSTNFSVNPYSGALMAKKDFPYYCTYGISICLCLREYVRCTNRQRQHALCGSVYVLLLPHNIFFLSLSLIFLSSIASAHSHSSHFQNHCVYCCVWTNE